MGRGVFAVTIWIFHFALLCFSGCARAQLSFNVAEEADKGTVVGNLAKDLNLNINILRNRELRILSDNLKKYFDVDLKTGELFVCDRIDREELCPRMEKCTLHIEAILTNPTQLHRLEVHVADLNDNAPFFREKIYVFNVSESSSTGERYLLPVANDPDWGINSIKNYRLSSNEYFSLDGGQQSESAELVLQKPLDREKVSTIHLTLTALISVDISDVNDNAPHFSNSVLGVYIKENAPIGSIICTLITFLFVCLFF
uniref:Cadherin domain-containing protein n=1 Tax=Periophthalmus magnuspinnatus TaxID=409849 RepID=A0A3B3ZBG9_9GOBI